jgi:hypothetical protein
MDAREVVANLEYVGAAQGTRQTYSIFRGLRHYLVVSFKKDDPQAGNFTILSAEAVDYVQQKYAGEKGMTAKRLFEESQRTRHFRDRLAALNGLYVLVALGKASVDHRFRTGGLVFNLA